MSDHAPKPDEELLQLPTSEELPCEDGVPLESSKHRMQIDLLAGALSLRWRDRDDFFVGGNMFLYFSTLQTTRNDFGGPDFFVVLGTRNRHRKSWVMWEEERAPDVIVEVTSPSTREEDYSRKKAVYGEFLRVPHYYIFDPITGELDGFQLDLARMSYTAADPGTGDRLRCQRLGLEIGVWPGAWRGLPGPWLRWFTPEGDLVLTPEEHAEQEAVRAEQEAAARKAAEARIADLEAQLRALRGD